MCSDPCACKCAGNLSACYKFSSPHSNWSIHGTKEVGMGGRARGVASVIGQTEAGNLHCTKITLGPKVRGFQPWVIPNESSQPPTSTISDSTIVLSTKAPRYW